MLKCSLFRLLGKPKKELCSCGCFGSISDKVWCAQEIPFITAYFETFTRQTSEVARRDTKAAGKTIKTALYSIDLVQSAKLSPRLDSVFGHLNR